MARVALSASILLIVSVVSWQAACSSDDAAVNASDSGSPDAASPSIEADSATSTTDAAPVDPTGVFVAVGYGGRRTRSTDDGLTWADDLTTEPDGGGDDQDLLRTVAYADGTFLAVGWKSSTSPDGKTWTPLVTTKQNWFGALARADGNWIAVGGYGMRLKSADGTNWKNHMIDGVAAHPHGCLVVVTAPAPGFVACNDNGARSWSSDGETWAYATGALDAKSSELAVGNGVVVGIDGTSIVTSSDGGHTWTAGAPLDAAGGGLVFAGGHFTHLGTNAVYTSTDGKTWMKTVATGLRPAATAFGHGTYVAVSGHTFWRSVDGVVWTSTKEATTVNSLLNVAFGAAP